MQVTDIAAAEDFDNAETDEIFDVVDSFVHVHNIEKSGINVNANFVYFIIQTFRVLTDDERFVIFGNMELLEMYAQRFSTEL